MDKFLHFIAGAAIAFIVIIGSYSIGNTYNIPVNKPIITITGTTVGIMAGIAKELYDNTGHGTVEILDIVATSLGAVSIAGLSYLVLP